MAGKHRIGEPSEGRATHGADEQWADDLASMKAPLGEDNPPEPDTIDGVRRALHRALRLDVEGVPEDALTLGELLGHVSLYVAQREAWRDELQALTQGGVTEPAVFAVPCRTVHPPDSVDGDGPC
jgi:hypothetical protein